MTSILFKKTVSACMGVLVLGLAGSCGAAELSSVRQAELRHMLIQDCGSCHGLRMLGGLGPPLTPEALAGKPAEALRIIILEGVPDSAMPPWKSLLNEAEVDFMVELMLRGVRNEK